MNLPIYGFGCCATAVDDSATHFRIDATRLHALEFFNGNSENNAQQQPQQRALAVSENCESVIKIGQV